MNLSRREMILAWMTLLTLGVLLLGIHISRRWDAVRRDATERRGLQRRARDMIRMIARRPEFEGRFKHLLERLPDRDPGQDVTAELLREMERQARDRNVTLTRREADRERRVGEMFEVSVTAAWEADLESLVGLLYALETQGPMRQIRQLTVSASRDGRLRGTVIVDHAYTRLKGAAASQAGTEQGR